jgi:hypothetical protein
MKLNIKKKYEDLRKEEYPSIVDQLDMLWHGIDAGTFGEQAKMSDFYNSIKTVKDNHIKDESAKSSQFFKELRKVKEDIPKE